MLWYRSTIKVFAVIKKEEKHEKNSANGEFALDCRRGGYGLWLCGTGASTRPGSSTSSGTKTGASTSSKTRPSPSASSRTKTATTSTGLAQVSSRDYSTTGGFAFVVFSWSSQDYREVYRNTDFTSAGEWFPGGIHGHG